MLINLNIIVTSSAQPAQATVAGCWVAKGVDIDAKCLADRNQEPAVRRAAIIEVAAGPECAPGRTCEYEWHRFTHVGPAVAEFFCPKDDRVIEESALSRRIRRRLQLVDDVRKLRSTPSLRLSELPNVIGITIGRMGQSVVPFGIANPGKDDWADGVTELNRRHLRHLAGQGSHCKVDLCSRQLRHHRKVIFVHSARSRGRLARTFLGRKQATLQTANRIKVAVEFASLDAADAALQIVQFPEIDVENTPSPQTKVLEHLGVLADPTEHPAKHTARVCVGVEILAGRTIRHAGLHLGSPGIRQNTEFHRTEAVLSTDALSDELVHGHAATHAAWSVSIREHRAHTTLVVVAREEINAVQDKEVVAIVAQWREHAVRPECVIVLAPIRSPELRNRSIRTEENHQPLRGCSIPLSPGITVQQVEKWCCQNGCSSAC